MHNLLVNFGDDVRLSPRSLRRSSDASRRFSRRAFHAPLHGTTLGRRSTLRSQHSRTVSSQLWSGYALDSVRRWPPRKKRQVCAAAKLMWISGTARAPLAAGRNVSWMAVYVCVWKNVIFFQGNFTIFHTTFD